MKKRIAALFLSLMLCLVCLTAAGEQTDVQAIQQAAQDGDPEAMNELGLLYYNGEGVEQNDTLAVYWWYAAANAGDADAMYNVGYMFANGRGTERNEKEMLRWWKEGAQHGNRLAAFAMGIICQRGVQGEKKNSEKARGYFMQAAQLRFQPELVLIYFDWEIPEAACFASVSRQAEGGSAAAMCDLGYLYFYGIGTEKNDALASYWWYAAAEAGVPMAMYNTAYMFMHGLGIGQNTQEAERWIREFAKAGRAGRAGEYQRIYTQQSANTAAAVPSAPKEPELKSVSFEGNAAETGRAAALTAVTNTAASELRMYAENGKLAQAWTDGYTDNGTVRTWRISYSFKGAGNRSLSFTAGNGKAESAPFSVSIRVSAPDTGTGGQAGVSQRRNIEIDAGQPEEMMRLLGLDELMDAAALGDLDAAYIIGWCFANGVGVEQDDERAFEWFLMLAEEGIPGAYLWVAEAYRNGKGVEQNDAEALRWYEAAAEEGDDDLKLRVGNFYYRGQMTPEDYSRALYWYLQSAEEGNVIAMGNAADIYNYGRGNVPQDVAKAFALYKQSAEAGNVTSMGNLGVCYINGRGTGKDTALGAYWITRAAEEGNATAMYNLGQLYEKGIGVQKSASAARSWYEKAAAAGNADAKKKLGQ